jgi:desulfoferrodoxin (superoxide reductase-like protein)
LVGSRDFFGLNKDNVTKIKAKVGKIAFYMTPEGKADMIDVIVDQANYIKYNININL